LDILKMNASKIRQKLLQKFGNDPLYKAVIVANDEKDMKKAIKILKSIRGAPAFTQITTYAKKLQKENKNQTQQKIKEIIKEEIQMLRENKDKMLAQADSIWLSWNPGSGYTHQIKKGFITDKKGDAHFNSMAKDILKWSEKNTPMKKNKRGKLYKLPHYSRQQLYNPQQAFRSIQPSDYDIWGGDVKPEKYVYMHVHSDKYIVISFFTNKNEALSWLKH